MGKKKAKKKKGNFFVSDMGLDFSTKARINHFGCVFDEFQNEVQENKNESHDKKNVNYSC